MYIQTVDLPELRILHSVDAFYAYARSRVLVASCSSLRTTNAKHSSEHGHNGKSASRGNSALLLGSVHHVKFIRHPFVLVCVRIKFHFDKTLKERRKNAFTTAVSFRQVESTPKLQTSNFSEDN